MNIFLNNLRNNLASALRNTHVSFSIVAMGACAVGAIWLPAHAQQFQATSKIFEGYAVLAAANSGPVKQP